MVPDLLPFNDRAKDAVRNCGFFTVWEGAVRSGKTTESTFAFMLNLITSRDHRHLITGKSQSAALANCVDGDFGLIGLSGGIAKIKRDKKNETYVDFLGKRVDLFGGENISSFKAFRGRSYGSVYMDEANLQHPNTIVECFNRTMAAKDRRHFATLNPDVPSHWFYRDYLDKYAADKMPGYRWHHRTLLDNPAISEERRNEIARQFTGVFYQRFVLGLRVRAEGSCYPSFNDACIIDEPPNNVRYCIIGVDIGGNKSATTFCLCGFFFIDKRWNIVILDEYYDRENKSTESVLQAFKAFTERHKKLYTITEAYSDSAEQLIKKSLDNLGVVSVYNSKKLPVIDRIRFTDLMMQQGRFKILRHCRKTIEAIQSASWNAKADKEERLDDGTVNVDSLDAMEYSFETRMHDF